MKATQIRRYATPPTYNYTELEQNADEWALFLGNLYEELNKNEWITHVHLDSNDAMNRRFTHVVVMGEIEV